MKKILLCITLMALLLVGCGKGNQILKINYLDDTIPGGKYYFEFNKTTNILSIEIEHYSSVVDSPNNNIKKNVTIDDTELNSYIIKAFKLVNKKSEWSYSICNSLENIDDIIKNNVEQTKENTSDELWTSLYDFYDTNDDDIVTYKEEFYKIIDEASLN